MAQILNGKQTANQIKDEIAKIVASNIQAGKKQPHLAAILVGEDGASQTYINHKIKSCERCGFQSTLKTFPDSVTQEELLASIQEFNNNDDIDGYIVQLPLPKHINEDEVIEAIAPEKDVDGFHPINMGKLALGQEAFVPATPKGIMELLSRYNIETEGKHCVVLGRSNIVGRPMSILLSNNDNPGNCTVTLCHSRTKDLNTYTTKADILVVALGKPAFVTGDMVKEGVVIVDVGITRVEDATKKSGYRLQGDVDFQSVEPKSSAITPVPGGVGPMTVVSLMMNTLRAAERKNA